MNQHACDPLLNLKAEVHLDWMSNLVYVYLQNVNNSLWLYPETSQGIMLMLIFQLESLYCSLINLSGFDSFSFSIFFSEDY